MSSLPPEIITSILILLPVKSLLRFRCVSKPWCAQIDSPQFINLHLNHSIATGSNHFLIAQSEFTLYSLDSDSLEKLEKIVTPFNNIPHTTKLLDTCNGLLLLDANGLILFNPSTRKHIVLPTPPPENRYLDGSSSNLGYDAINDDYKVFTISILVDKAQNLVTREAMIYSLKSNLWRTVRDYTNEMDFTCGVKVLVNGALHALHKKDCRTIVAKDVGKENFYMIPMPDFEKENLLYSMLVPHAFDGCLAVLCWYRDNRFDIWVMKEYGVKKSWTMLLSVKPETPYAIVMPLVYSKGRTEVLLSYGYINLVWYDLKKKTVRDFESSGLPVGFCQVCVGSLVSVGSTRRIDEEKKRLGEEK